MKKLVSLLLALVCLLSMTSVLAEDAAAAETPALNTPITVEAYKQAYEEVIHFIDPEATIAWTTLTSEDMGAYAAIINDSFYSVLIMPAEDMTAELAVLLSADLSEDSLSYFLSLAAYAGAALLVDEEVTPEAACNAFFSELYDVFTSIINDIQPEDIYGLPGGITINLADDGSYQYYFVLSLTAE